MVSSDARVTVMGAGSWGTALAHLLAGNGHRVTLWCLEEEVAEAVNGKHENPVYMPGVTLSDGITATTDMAGAVKQADDMLVWVVPSQFTGKVFGQIAKQLGAGVPIVSATKGIEESSLRLMTEVMAEWLPDGDGRLTVLSGPSFAKEVVHGMPTAVAVAGEDESVTSRVQALFASEQFRVYTNSDPVGTQLGGALKNVVALAAGAVEGLGLGYNTQAVLITRGLTEITRLGLAMGAQASTFSGLAGVGDLVLTCTGGLSRNRQVGIALGQGKSLEQILSEMNMVAEGVKTTAGAHKLAARMGVDMPIVEQVHRVLFEGVSPGDALADLMARPQKSENEMLAE